METEKSKGTFIIQPQKPLTVYYKPKDILLPEEALVSMKELPPNQNDTF